MKRWSMSILKILVVIFLVGTAIMLGINFYVVRSAKDRLVTKGHTDSTIHADCILVLGAGIRADGSPTPMLKDRLDTAIEVYKSGAAPKLLMSGDHSREDYDEVQTMKDYAIDKGVPSEDIFMDHAGFSTYESLYRARDIFQAQNIVIVTQKYHLYRALYTAEALSLQALGVPADTKTYGGQTYRDLREILARNKDFLTSIYKPKPTYLGDTIPVNGNGNITND
ncbi:ElyC/SanA/YdcF family protein [Faecalicatena orotica]|uniref:Vancomycin permeability regulator SanA n=1 Tax=Faecalicatena orotica TaxID=1544 RepID=A0A2Y9BN24_9FIRM|nr:ElyC/SanA/YdcF family protein [Faecalicatena orotica]PWJ23168.1 vancomycin permeability regulator SanA [Faecalicatena orotica]SSA57905.1 protein SanA, affects membrane permeability for vancomycin [Faecalicatena orotica]